MVDLLTVVWQWSSWLIAPNIRIGAQGFDHLSHIRLFSAREGLYLRGRASCPDDIKIPASSLTLHMQHNRNFFITQRAFTEFRHVLDVGW